jgi:hypothetical protein
MYNSWDANFKNAQNIWSQDFSTWEAGVNQAYQSANLQLDIYGQQVENAYNLYNANMNMYESMYSKEYQKWQDQVTQAQQYASVLNTDWWNQTNFDESVRQYDQNYEQTERWKQKEFDASYTSDGNGGYVKKGNTSDDNSLTSTEAEKVKEIFAQAGGGEKGYSAVDNYLSIIGKNNLSEEGAAALKSTLGGTDVPVYYQDWTITKDTKNGNFLGLSPDDMNDEYTNSNGQTMTFKQLKKAIENSNLSEEEKKKRLDNLRKQSTK